MTTVVGVLDRDEPGANTDVLVRVDPSARLLEWVPRDLWCRSARDRINRAWALGGGDGLHAALAEHGLEAEHHVIVPRALAERCLSRVDVAVPVDRREEYWYPLTPTSPIEEGRRRVSFDPPAVRLSGERVHQWIGARYRVGAAGSDLDRITRQQALLRELVRQGFDFAEAPTRGMPRPELSDPGALAELGCIDGGWQMATLGRLRPAQVDGMEVLLRDSGA